MQRRARRSWLAAAAGIALALLPGLARAQAVRSVDVPHTRAAPPEIDGVLDDEIWEGPPTISDFHQVFPDYGEPATERTEVWVRRDDEAFYLGVRMHDRRPDLIIARQLLRDGAMMNDDRLNLMFDTFNNRRSGFFFQTNPLGTRGEASSEQGPVLRLDWDVIWYCAATVDAGGWTAEIAIPFQSLPLDPDSDVWGFEVERVIQRRSERARWANWSPNHIISEPGNTGEIRGMLGAKAAVLDVKPGFSLASSYDRTRRNDVGPPDVRRGADSDLRGRGTLDVFYRPLPSVTASLTVNPDFSDAPVDLRQNNLTRFETFFPETRDFFLEDIAIFKFADLTQNGLPFYSRRIGLVDERPIDLDAGLKLTGHVGNLEFGALQVQTGSEPFRSCKAAPTPAEERACGADLLPTRPAIDPQSLSVARAKWNLGEESSVGMILTNGDPRDEIDNNLVGADLIYRNSHLPGGGRLVATSWLMRTESSDVGPLDAPLDLSRQLPLRSGADYAWGGRLEYPTDHISAYVTFADFREDFDPRLGYVNRSAVRNVRGSVAFYDRVGIRDYSSFLRYRTRPAHSWIRTIDHGFQARVVTDRDNRLETQEITLNLVEVANGAEDKFRLSYLLNQERPDLPPYIHPQAWIPAGDYAFQQVQLLLESSGSRRLKGKLELTSGEYYDGRITRAVAAIELRPSPRLFVSLEWDQADARLQDRVVELCSDFDTCGPTFPVLFPGDFTKRLARLKLNLAFTKDVSWINTVQYDNVSDTTSLNSRLRWEVTPGREVFFVINQGWLSDVETIDPATTQLTAKAVWTYRF